MRLIDADGLVTKILEEHKKAEDTYDLCVDEVKDILCGIVSLIDEQPTAYDPDKVVEQLEKKIQTHKNCIEYEKKNGTVTEEFQQRKAVEVLEGAIVIVKGGGLDG